jgi:hypothetical protein
VIVAAESDLALVGAVLERVARLRARPGLSPEYDAWLGTFAAKLDGYRERGQPLCRADRAALERIASRLDDDPPP